MLLSQKFTKITIIFGNSQIYIDVRSKTRIVIFINTIGRQETNICLSNSYKHLYQLPDSNCFTFSDMVRPSAFPVNSLEAIPITLPKSCIEVAPNLAIIAFTAVVSSASDI